MAAASAASAASARSGGLASLEHVWGPRRPRTQGTVVGTTVAIALHVLVGAALLRVDAAALRPEAPVEMEVQEPPPPPPPEIKPEEPPPPAPEPKPRVVVHHVAAPTPPTEAPPPPSEAPPPKAAQEAPPVFGVSLDSTVSGDGPGVAVPVGNTLNTKPTNRKGPPGPLAGSPTSDSDGLPAPVPEFLIAEDVRVLYEPKVEFPPEAQRMGIEGRVKLRVYVDSNGAVQKVTVIEKAGHGFDELARDALRKFKFSPARTQDGKAVPRAIVYIYNFQTPQ